MYDHIQFVNGKKQPQNMKEEIIKEQNSIEHETTKTRKYQSGMTIKKPSTK